MSKDLKQLAINSIAGNKEDLEEFLKKTRDITLSFVKKRLFEKSLAEDATQEIVMAIYNSLKTFDKSEPIEPWLFTIIRRRLIDFTRKHNPKKVKEVFKDETFFSSLESCEELSGFKDFVEILDTLTKRSKDIITGLHLEGKSRSELAIELETSEGNVRVMAHRALKEFYKLFNK